MTRVGTGVMQFTADDSKLQSTVRRIEQTMVGLQSRLGAMGRAAIGLLGGLGIGASLNGVINAAAEAEEAQAKLTQAIQGSGASVDEWGGKLSKAADDIRSLTAESDEAARLAMAFAINLGVGVDKAEAMTKAAVGLKQILGTDLQDGIRQLILAQQGEFRTLERTIPALKAAGTAAEKMAVINRMASEGYRQAQGNLGTYSKQMQFFKSELGELQEAIGTAMLPAATNLVRILRFVVGNFGDLANALPKPMLEAFQTIASGIDVMLGSFEGLKTGVELIWSSMIEQMTKAWVGFTVLIKNGWVDLKGKFDDFTTMTGGKIAGEIIPGVRRAQQSPSESPFLSAITNPVKFGMNIDKWFQETPDQRRAAGEAAVREGEAALQASGQTDAMLRDQREQREKLKAENDRKGQEAIQQANDDAQKEQDALKEKLKQLPKASDQIKAFIDGLKQSQDPNNPNQVPDLSLGDIKGKDKTAKKEEFQPVIEGLEDTFKRIQTASATIKKDPAIDTAENTKEIADNTDAMADATDKSAGFLEKATGYLKKLVDRPDMPATFA